VYVKYDLVPKTSSQEVVTAIKAQHWAYWQVSCPDGWTPVGPLTTKTKSSCYRIGLCALYKPFNDAETFVTNTGISYGKFANPASKCQAVCGANSNLWPMYTDGLDIHWGCGDERWVYFCYNQAQAWPSRPLTMEFTKDEKLTLLEQYAPRLIFHPNERFYPSSVEWSFDHLFRYSPNDLPDFIPWPPLPYHLFDPPDDRYYVATKKIFASPSDWFDYHYGCNGSATNTPCQLSDAPAYAFWNEQTISQEEEDIEVVDLVYFFYFPYNRGKEYFDTIWGNHVGDWEHITVRLGWVYNQSTGWEIRPIHMFVSAHDFGTSHPWDTVTTISGTDHPVVYVAEGGHGIYATEGPEHRYGKVKIIGVTLAFLFDYTGEGKQWDTWNRLETLDFDTQTGLGDSIWPRWLPGTGWATPEDKNAYLKSEYAKPCADDLPGCNPYDPASGPIYRWGNNEFRCDVPGVCRMEKGPTGPIDKGMWDNPFEP